MTSTIALVQVASPAAEPIEDRRHRVAEMVRSAADADLVVLPELWDVGYFAFDRYAASAQDVDGPTVRMLAEVAREIGAAIHVGSIVERAPGGRLRNTAVLLDRQGRVGLTSSKVHVFGHESLEADLLEPGTGAPVTRTDLGATASTTCYDLRFPELWRTLVDNGAETVVVPAAWPAARREHWRLFTSARAAEEQILVVACNAVGVQDGIGGPVELGGTSRIVDPWGVVLAEAGTEEGVTLCEVDPGVVARTRAAFPVLRDRLPSYTHLAAPPEAAS